jgi:hypothetical protein
MTQGEESAHEASEKMDAPITVADIADKLRHRTPGFSRMRVEWRGEDAHVVAMVEGAVERRILAVFGDAFQIMHSVFEVVRTPEVNAQGVALKDVHGFTVWKRSPIGGWEEDFSRLTTQQRENFLFQITTRIFDWKQRAAMLWGESMLAKAQWEERYAIAFDAPISGTIEDRESKGKMDAADERYFAIFATLISKRADAICDSLELLAQRLKDSLMK